jgi:all-trans-retinol 13,14-reductase
MPYNLFGKWENTITGRRGEEYIEFKQETASRLLDLVEKRFPGLRPGIRYMEVSTPLTWRDNTGIPEGSMYGIERDYNNPPVSNLLPATKLPGFYFTGQNINIHGVLGVTIGAVLTCGEIVGLKYLLNKIKNS